MMKTQWVYAGANLEVRYVGPAWLARFLCWYPFVRDGETVYFWNKMNLPLIRALCFLVRARLEYRAIGG